MTFSLWGLDSGCYAPHVPYLVRAQPSAFPVVDLSGSITQCCSGTSNHEAPRRGEGTCTGKVRALCQILE